MAINKAPSTADLAPYVLADVEGLEDAAKKIEEGHGAFGVVYKVTVKGSPCMAKRLHEILITEVSQEEKDSMEAKFMNECVLLSKLSHPNVVHFVGVCYGKSERDLALIMERLHTDVAAFVKTHPNVPISINLSIMLDVSYGLKYLHGQTPPIIHRDLTAPNVLLTPDLRAKIADLGVSKVLSDPSIVKQTTAPGNANYMAPETKIQDPVYGTGVDIFAAGHLILHICIQDWPKLYKVVNHLKILPGETEIAERMTSLEKMGHGHCLYDLTIQCLRDNPKERPSTSDFNKALNILCWKHPKTFKDLCKIQDPCDLQQELQESRQKMAELTGGLELQQVELHQLARQRDDLLGELEAHKLRAQTYADDFVAERKDREQAHSRMAEMETRYNHQIQSLANELQTKTRELEDLRKESQQKDQQNNQLGKEKQQLQKDAQELQDRLDYVEATGGDSRSSSSSLSVQLKEKQAELDKCVTTINDLTLQNTLLISERDDRKRSVPSETMSVPASITHTPSSVHPKLHHASTYPRESQSDPQKYSRVPKENTDGNDLRQVRQQLHYNEAPPQASNHGYVNARQTANTLDRRMIGYMNLDELGPALSAVGQHTPPSHVAESHDRQQLTTLPAYTEERPTGVIRDRSKTIGGRQAKLDVPNDGPLPPDRHQSLRSSRSNPLSSSRPKLPEIKEEDHTYEQPPLRHDFHRSVSSPVSMPTGRHQRTDPALPVYENVLPVSTSPVNLQDNAQQVQFQIGSSSPDLPHLAKTDQQLPLFQNSSTVSVPTLAPLPVPRASRTQQRPHSAAAYQSTVSTSQAQQHPYGMAASQSSAFTNQAVAQQQRPHSASASQSSVGTSQALPLEHPHNVATSHFSEAVGHIDTSASQASTPPLPTHRSTATSHFSEAVGHIDTSASQASTPPLPSHRNAAASQFSEAVSQITTPASQASTPPLPSHRSVARSQPGGLNLDIAHQPPHHRLAAEAPNSPRHEAVHRLSPADLGTAGLEFVAGQASPLDGIETEDGGASLLPYDPNLVCPICNRKFRKGEIQKFKRHANGCKQRGQASQQAMGPSGAMSLQPSSVTEQPQYMAQLYIKGDHVTPEVSPWKPPGGHDFDISAQSMPLDAHPVRSSNADVECPHCTRRFAYDDIEEHTRTCQAYCFFN